MGKVGLEKFYMCIAIPQCICSIILIAVVLTFAGTDWDQDVLDHVDDSWKTKVLEDVALVSSTQSCSSGYSTASYSFDGTNTLCKVTRGTNIGKFYYRSCGTVKEKEDTCTYKDGKNSCKTKTVKYSEGTTYTGLSDQTAKIFSGAKVCYKRGDYDYYDFAKDRQTWSQDNGVIACLTTETKCGGTTSSATDIEHLYCYKAKTSGFTCPIQDFTAAASYSTKYKTYSLTGAKYTDDRSVAPLFDVEMDLEPRCLHGKRYTPNRALPGIFDEDFACKKKETNWDGTTTLNNMKQTGASMYEYNLLFENGIVNTVYNKYYQVSGFTYNWNTQTSDLIYLYKLHYPHWDYDCHRANYHPANFKKLIDKMGTISAMAMGISICQYIVCAFSVIFLVATCIVLKCGKVKRIPNGLHYGMLAKLAVTILLNLTCFALVIIMMLSGLGLDKKEIEYYEKNDCIASYITYQFEKFMPFYKSVVTNSIIIFVACFLQNVYEALIYPSIKFKWIGRFIQFHDGEGPEHEQLPQEPNKTIDVKQNTSVHQVAPTPMAPVMMAPQPGMVMQPGMM
jgi:hypothetical protein